MKDIVNIHDVGNLYATVTLKTQSGLWTVVDAHKGYTVRSLSGDQEIVVSRSDVKPIRLRRLINRYKDLHPSIAAADMILNEREKKKQKLKKRLEATVRGIKTDYRSLKSSRDAATKNNNSRSI